MAAILYTDYGRKNWKNWLDIGGFDNISFYRNGHVMKLLTKLSIENLMHPFQTFILVKKPCTKCFKKFGIDLTIFMERMSQSTAILLLIT